MPAVIPIIARIGLILKSLSWSTVAIGVVGTFLALGIIPFFMNQQKSMFKRVTSPLFIVTIAGLGIVIYLIQKEAKRK